MADRVHCRCACGVEYTPEEWDALPCVGVQHCGGGYSLDLRNCVACGSTLAVELWPLPLVAYLETRFADLENEIERLEARVAELEGEAA